MRLKLVSCEVLYREICAAVSRSPNVVDVEFLSKGLHDVGAGRMPERIQAALDRVDAARYEAVLLGYGLCNNGLAGLTARSLPLVAASRPRLHHAVPGEQGAVPGVFQRQPGSLLQNHGVDGAGREP